MRFAKLYKLRTNTFVAVTAALLLLTHTGQAGAMSATPNEYDPRRDPNYIRETSERTSVNWQTVWALAREFEARAYMNIDRPQMTAPYAQPQPWHYVEGAPSFGGSMASLDAPIYGGPYVGSWYAYGPSLSGWWGTSPRIPWRSLVPFNRNHHGHRGHHEGKGHHHW
jgi:hypothetical protein